MNKLHTTPVDDLVSESFKLGTQLGKVEIRRCDVLHTNGAVYTAIISGLK